MKISIVLPTYNQACYLPAALDSIAGQTFRDFELIVVNDGSTDETRQVLGDYQRRLDFQVIDQDNQGLPRALNAGFAAARGDYLTWTSSDNVMLPDMLDVLNRELDADPTMGVVYADWYFVGNHGQAPELHQTLEYDRHLLLRYNYVHCCFLFRRACLERVGGYDPDFEYCEDWLFWIQVSRYFEMKHVPQALYYYRVHSTSMTAELQTGTPRRGLSRKVLERRLRRSDPISYYYSKLKWHLLKWRLGYDPLQAWLATVEKLA